MSSNFVKYGLPAPHKYVGFQKINKSEQCCLFGHMSILMMARCLNLPYVYIFEDDAYPRRDIVDKLKYYIQSKPSNCGILVFGENGYSQNITYHGDYHIVHERPFGAHAYLVYSECYDSLLNSMEKVRIADVALRYVNFKDCDKKPYWTNDILFIQKNIDNNCMSSAYVNTYGKYFYPKKVGRGVGVYDCVPDENWD
jgi:GR25 family glycosyltransferase involved in LPS biosynthesis